VLEDVVPGSDPGDDVIVPLLAQPTACVFGALADLLGVCVGLLGRPGPQSQMTAALLLACEVLDVTDVNVSRLHQASIRLSDYGIGEGRCWCHPQGPWLSVWGSVC
jgi:hypothetical protein